MNELLAAIDKLNSIKEPLVNAYDITSELKTIRNLLIKEVSKPRSDASIIDLVKQLIDEKNEIIDAVRKLIGRLIGVHPMPGLNASLISLEIEFSILKNKLERNK